MKIRPQTAIAVTIAIFISGIIITSGLGVWTTQSRKTPSKFSDMNHSEQYDPADIRGSYMFSDISHYYNIPLDDLFTAFGADSATTPNFKCKDLEIIYSDSQYEVGTSSVKLFVAYYLGLPYQPTEEIYLPDTAIALLAAQGNLTPAQQAYLESHSITTA